MSADNRLPPRPLSYPVRSASLEIVTRQRTRVCTLFAAGVLALGGTLLAAAPAFAAVSDPDNPAVSYADAAWNWIDPAGHKAPAGADPTDYQQNFECAEFVARALADEGLIPGLTENSPRTGPGSFEQYTAWNNKTYNLLNVGSDATWNGIPLGYYNAGLWDYLIDTGLGTDIGSNPAQAYPGDVMFWYSGGPADGAHRHHAALVVQSGNAGDLRYDAHYNARYHQAVDDGEVHTIVRINSVNLKAHTTTLARNTTNCPGNDQYFPDHDVNGVAIDRTYANGGNACVQVAYLPRTTSASCAFRFWVPSGHATARIVFGYWTTDGVKHYVGLDEAPRDGWYTIFTSANVTAINFQDNNGQAYPLEIGWGTDRYHGMRQEC